MDGLVFTRDRVATSPSVGIFWGVNAGPEMALITVGVSLSGTETYGDCLTYPRGHFELWEGWKRLGPLGRAKLELPQAIASYEYEEFPRGRIVYSQPDSLFTIYADRRLQQPHVVAEIQLRFCLLESRTVVRSDPHYR